MILFYKKKKASDLAIWGFAFSPQFRKFAANSNNMSANLVNVSDYYNDRCDNLTSSYESGLSKIFDYNGSSVTFRTIDGTLYVNSTEMSKKFGKVPGKWLELPSTKEFIKTISVIRKLDNGAVQTIRGGVNGGGSTWMHEDVALEFARWLDPIFAIWCNDRIKELIPYFDFKTKKNSKRADSAEELIKCTLHVAEFLLDKLGGSKATVAAFVNKTSRAIGIPEIDYVPSDGVKFSATDLLKKFGRTETIYQFNKKMIERGLLEEKQRKSRTSKTGYKKFKCLTDTGLEYGDNEVSPSNPNEVQPRYFEKKFNELLDLIF